jgi:protein-disulfide isomerase
MNRKVLFVSAVVALFAAFVIGMLLYASQKNEQAAAATARNAASLARAHAPTLGDPAAKVHIVEFLDPACETCRAFFPLVKQIMASEPERIRLSTRHVALHQGSYEVVLMLEAARAQDRYWPTLERVLATQPHWVINHVAHADRVWPLLDGLGLDLVRLRQDMGSAEVGQRAALDAADAKALNVTKTPEYFVNGRPMPSFGLEQLQALVKDALRSSY